MMEVEIAGALAQFGVAGMVGWMWLTERRAAATREQQLTQAHEALMRDREKIEVLVELTGANTRAMTALEAVQREMMRVLDSLGKQLCRSRADQTLGRATDRAEDRTGGQAAGRAAG